MLSNITARSTINILITLHDFITRCSNNHCLLYYNNYMNIPQAGVCYCQIGYLTITNTCLWNIHIMQQVLYYLTIYVWFNSTFHSITTLHWSTTDTQWQINNYFGFQNHLDLFCISLIVLIIDNLMLSKYR